MGANLPAEGCEMAIFRYVLQPLYGALSQDQDLKELYSNVMQPRYTNAAILHVWLGLEVVDTVDLSPLKKLLKLTSEPLKPLIMLLASDIKIKKKEEVLCNRFLAEVAKKLASDSKNSKTFIQYVIGAEELKGNPTAAKLMPPQEKQQVTNSFLPYILRLFKIAQDQCVIRPSDFTKLREWLKECFLEEIALEVEEFNLGKECK